MRNNLLSLFVGAAIAGSVFSSSHAEITVSPKARDELLALSLQRIWGFLQNLKGDFAVPQDLKLFDYTDDDAKEDAKALCDAVCTKNSGLPLENYFSGGGTCRKSLIQLANDAFKEQGGNELFWLFFERKGVGIFLKYCVCNVAVDFPKNFEDLKSVHTVPDSVIEKVWKRIYVGEGGIWAKDFLLTHVESVYKNHRGNPFKLRDCTEKWIRENESAVRNKWLPGCYEILLNRQIASLFAEKFFSDDYIESVRGILLRGCFPSCINETKFRGRLDRGETPVQTTILVKYVQFLRDYQDAKNSDAPEAKEKFLKGAKFLKAFCIGDRNAEEAEKKGYRFVNPNLRKRILNGVQEMQKEFEE